MSTDELVVTFKLDQEAYTEFAELAAAKGLELGEFFSLELRKTVKMEDLNEDLEAVHSALQRDIVDAGLKELSEGWEQKPTLPDFLCPDWVDSLEGADLDFVDGYLKGVDFIATKHRVVWTPTGLFVFID